MSVVSSYRDYHSDSASTPSPVQLHKDLHSSEYDNCQYRNGKYCCSKICTIVVLLIFTTVSLLITGRKILHFHPFKVTKMKKASYSYHLSCRYVIRSTCGYITGKFRTTKLPSKVGNFNPSPDPSSKNLVCFDALGSCGFIKIIWLNLNTVPKNRDEISSVTRKLNVLWQIYNLKDRGNRGPLEWSGPY